MLKQHHEAYHAPCPICEHIVFTNDIELNTHLLQVHSNELTKKERDQLKKVKRAFVSHEHTPTGNVEAKVENIKFINCTKKELASKESKKYQIKKRYDQERAKAVAKSSFGSSTTKVTYQASSPIVTEESSSSPSSSKSKLHHNEILMKSVKELPPMERKEFIASASGLQKGTVKVMRFYETFLRLFGYHDTCKLFPHLIGSLPDKCRDLLPALNTVHQSHKDKGFRMAAKDATHRQVEEAFPPLGGQSSNGSNDASWGRIVNNQRRQ
eukprot:CAMPEP_0117425418 /NCGR_PEP_ID=MMETSP0758-20121206/5674_1 /TAXON_ID=63605 /ORGANISM="Percolomonas cosmopolitus, Strain AE-1 (ATCC 50343)" /LENGTH=267 /DNA_ID=CAMNT_0005209851 /DNA_START=970 /DNA_END=1770 /DNA_ORIENTATION=-